MEPVPKNEALVWDYSGSADCGSLWVESDLYVYQGGSLIDSASASDDFDAYAQTDGGAIPNQTYEADGVTSYCQSNGLGENWWDPYGYDCEEVGGMAVTVNTAPGQPNIDSTSPSYGTVGDNNVSMSIYGEYLLNSDGSAPSISSSGSSSAGITFSNIQAVSTGEIDLTYSIASSASSSLIDISLTTDGGTAYSPDFEIGYPDPSISGVSPSTWQAGQTTDINIQGSNFGTSPSVTLDVGDITVRGVAVQQDGSIDASVAVPANEAATTVNITVEPGYSGCGAGNCLISSTGASALHAFQASIFGGSSCPTTITFNNSMSTN